MASKTSSDLILECKNIDQLSEVVQQIVEFSEGRKVWLFEGEMGAGKTTFIIELCRHFRVIDNVNSPTFSIVNEYQNDEKEGFYHFDFYRLEAESEAIDIGVDEYLYSGDYCFIEWPSKVATLLPDTVLKLNISVADNETRLIEITKHD